ncbi:Cupredoxin [Armillaria novae-zelandiae]|uniref:Cupredoxin n=1 Tax=Armillaria novae-zelandiae TaxID=153914 RepID=A0AA39PHM6_9AGAR|nr:Cupredoxin [Armillaria novae-zelandiae]
MFFILFAVLVSAVFVSAADHLVTVGDGGALAFNPTNVTALEGDTVTFSFRSNNHSATQSTFASPCNKSGIDSGFVPIASNSTQFGQWSFTVDNTTPLWFFCAQTGHCEAGMVFAVNTTPEKSFQAFLATAQGNGTASSSAGVSSTVVVSSASAGASATASSTANVNTASNGAGPRLRIHSITFSVFALVFGVLL